MHQFAIAQEPSPKFGTQINEPERASDMSFALLASSQSAEWMKEVEL